MRARYIAESAAGDAIVESMADLPSYDQLLAQAASAARIEARAAGAAPGFPPPPNVRLRNAALIAGGAAVVAGYGYHAWWKQGFTRRFRTRAEGGFGAHTEFSGIDKLGHVYSAYVGVRAMAPMFEAVGNTPQDARRIAAWTTWGAMTGIEILDGFSREYRFSHEDFIANTLGALLKYQDDIARVQGSEAARLLAELRAGPGRTTLGP